MHALYIEKSGVKWQQDEPGDLASGIVVSNQKSLLQKWPFSFSKMARHQLFVLIDSETEDGLSLSVTMYEQDQRFVWSKMG